MKKAWNKISKAWNKICIVDRFLLFFLLILFLYIIFYVFAGIQDTNTIDIIVRTSIAAIFGYFMSSNFTKTKLSSQAQSMAPPAVNFPQKSDQESPPDSIQNRIGFQPPSEPSNQKTGEASFSEKSSTPTDYYKMQILIVSAIGFISLIILIVTRHTQNVTPGLTAMISQLRDFVSACIGFLISCGKNIQS